MNKKIKIILSVIAIFILSAGLAAFFVYRIGKDHLLSEKIRMKNPVLVGAVTEKEGEVVHYKGKKYRYNEEISTILCMGIDHEERKQKKEERRKKGAGQADTIFLVILDQKKKKSTILHLSRDAMVDVDVYTADGAYSGILNQQLALSYAYGDGREKSCENTIVSVKRLLYGIPIASYVSLYLQGISTFNDAVGGVTVDIPEDLKKTKTGLIQGNRMILSGKQAQEYVQYRDADSRDIATNETRIRRQEQYVGAFLQKAIKRTKKNPLFPMELYEKTKDTIVTDIEVSELPYLVKLISDCKLRDANVLVIPGKTIAKNGHAQFIVDRKALFQIILDIFYEEE